MAVGSVLSLVDGWQNQNLFCVAAGQKTGCPGAWLLASGHLCFGNWIKLLTKFRCLVMLLVRCISWLDTNAKTVAKKLMNFIRYSLCVQVSLGCMTMLITVGGKNSGALQYTEAFISHRSRLMLMKTLKSIWNVNLVSIVHNRQEIFFFFFFLHWYKKCQMGKENELWNGFVLCCLWESEIN